MNIFVEPLSPDTLILAQDVLPNRGGFFPREGNHQALGCDFFDRNAWGAYLMFPTPVGTTIPCFHYLQLVTKKS